MLKYNQREGLQMIERRCKIDVTSVDFIVVECGSCGSRTEINRGKNTKVNTCNVCGAGYESSIQNLIIDFAARLIDCDRDKPRSKVYFVAEESER